MCRRFADPAWTHNLGTRRVVQAYLAAGQTVDGLVQDVPMDWQDAERVNVVASNLLQALSPSNSPLLSPVAWKTLIDTGGASLVTGLRQLVKDLATARRS